MYTLKKKERSAQMSKSVPFDMCQAFEFASGGNEGGLSFSADREAENERRRPNGVKRSEGVRGLLVFYFFFRGLV